MTTTRTDVAATLAVHDVEALRLILHASGVAPGGDTPAELAGRIADAIWWNYATPLGYYGAQVTLEDIVTHLARKLGVADRVDAGLPVYERVRRLTEILVEQLPEDGIRFDTVDETTRKRLGPSFLPSLGFGSGAAGSFTARWGTGRLLAFLRTPFGRVLPLLPGIGPWIGAIKTGAGAVFAVSGPLGVALSVASANAALGANYRKLVPLVLGIGALGVARVDEAVGA